MIHSVQFTYVYTGDRHMIKNHPCNQGGNMLPPLHGKEEGRKTLVNEAFKTVYYSYIRIRRIVKNNIDSEKRNPLSSLFD